MTNCMRCNKPVDAESEDPDFCARCIQQLNSSIMERAQANLVMARANESYNPERNRLTELTAFMATFHPEYNKQEVRKLLE